MTFLCSLLHFLRNINYSKWKHTKTDDLFDFNVRSVIMIAATADGYFFSSPASTPAMVPIQPPVQLVEGVPSKGRTATGAEITNA